MSNLVTELITTHTAGILTANFEEIEAAVDAKLAEITKTVYSGDRDSRIVMLKNDRADCNKAIKSLEDGRKSAKKLFLKPLEEFESEIKRISGKILSCSQELDSNVKALEDERREEKRAEIRAFYDGIKTAAGDYADTLYAKLYDTSWENVSSSKTKYQSALSDGVTSFVNGKNAIEMLTADDDIKADAFKLFYDTLDATKAMTYAMSKMAERAELRARIEAEAKRKAEEEAQKELEKRLAEERRKADEEIRIAEAAAKEAKEKAEQAERARIEAENKILVTEPVTIAPSTAELPVRATTKDKVVVEFNEEEWHMIKGFCDRNEYYYSEM